MKKKTKRNLIIAAIVIVLIAVGAAWFVYPSSVIVRIRLRTVQPCRKTRVINIRFSTAKRAGSCLIAPSTARTKFRSVSTRKRQALCAKIPSKPMAANIGGTYRLKAPMRIKRKILRNCTHSLLLLLVRQASKNRCSTASAKIT